MWWKQFRIWDCGLRIVEERNPQSAGTARRVVRNPQSNALPFWLLSGLACSLATGWLAARIHASGHAPVGLVSIGIGALLGTALTWLAAILHVRSRRFLLLTTAAMAILTVLSEHAWLYQDFRRQWSASRQESAAVAMFRPETPPSPRQYFTHEWQPALWVVDAGLILVSAAGMAWMWQRQRP